MIVINGRKQWDERSVALARLSPGHVEECWHGPHQSTMVDRWAYPGWVRVNFSTLTTWGSLLITYRVPRENTA